MERHYSRYWKEYRENRERKEREKAQKRTKAARTMVGVSLSSGLPGRRRLNYTRGVRPTPPFIRRVITSARAPPLKRKKKKGKRKKPHASEQQQLTFCHDGNEAPSISKTTPYFHFSLSFFSLWDVIRGIIRDLQFSSLIMFFFYSHVIQIIQSGINIKPVAVENVLHCFTFNGALNANGNKRANVPNPSTSKQVSMRSESST